MKSEEGTWKVWNKVYGINKDPIREYLLVNEILRLNKDFKNKVILDAGCGNGWLFTKLLKKKPKKMVGMDISKVFLDFARENIKSDKAEFIQRDIRKKFPFKDNYFDLTYTIFVIGSIDKLNILMKEVYRTLKKGGKYYIINIHPSYILSLYLYEKYTGKKNGKLVKVKEYFTPFETDYILSIAKQKSVIYHRTLEYYLDILIKNKFKITKFVELGVNKKIIKAFPRYKEIEGIPKFMIIEATK